MGDLSECQRLCYTLALKAYPTMTAPKLPVFRWHKQLGETPLQALERFRSAHPEYAHEKMTYAGRLDPQATGELIILVGPACHHKERFLACDKIYTFQVLLGYATDTGDIMGLVTDTQFPPVDMEPSTLSATLSEFVGTHTQRYPAYSTRTVQGKPLWQWHQEGRGHEVARPTQTITIYSMELIKKKYIQSGELKNIIKPRLDAVTGDFRQAAIWQRWQDVLELPSTSVSLPMLELRAHVSSGTYIRQLVMDWGEQLHVPMMCWGIEREQVVLPEDSRPCSLEAAYTSSSRHSRKNSSV